MNRYRLPCPRFQEALITPSPSRVRIARALAIAATGVGVLSATAAAGTVPLSTCLTSGAGGRAGLLTTPSANSVPTAIVAGPDGNLWFTEPGANAIARSTPSGQITEFPVPAGVRPHDIASGPDGNLWFTSSGTAAVGRITPTGSVTMFPVPSPTGGGQVSTRSITTGPDGNLWVTTSENDVVRMTPAGAGAVFPLGLAGGGAGDIISGPGGLLWIAYGGVQGGLVTVTTTGASTMIPTPGFANAPTALTVGPDGNVWYTNGSYGFITRVVIAAGGGATFTRFPKAVANSQANGWTTARGKMWFVGNAGVVGSVTTAGVITEYPVPTWGRFYASLIASPSPIAAGASGALWIAGPWCNAIASTSSAPSNGVWTVSRPASVTRGRTYTLRVRTSAAGMVTVALSSPARRVTIASAQVRKGTSAMRVTIPRSLPSALVGSATLAVNATLRGFGPAGQASPVRVR